MLIPIVTFVFLTALFAFGAACLYLLQRSASPRTELKRRLQQLAGTDRELPPELQARLAEQARRAGALVTGTPLARSIVKRLELAGMSIPPASVLAASALTVVVAGAATALVTGQAAPAAAAAAAVIGTMEIALRLRISHRRERFTELLPDALTMIARSLRAGHSLAVAVQLVAEEIPPPVGPLFRTAHEQQQLGLRMVDALTAMNERVESLDLRFFTTMVTINAEIGGNLAELLDKLAGTIRERLKIRRQVRVYTAQGRMSGYVLGALPLIAFLVFNSTSPEYESALLKEPTGLVILVLAALLQLVGLAVIRKIINIRI
ncbi:pilus assembly protein [Geomonas terrae]|uniref:Pilus assembly protein n=1 Tax=Geomonas terrae TaxID=2562681 RepID=A0A4S1CAL2_9BACT|nr:type II secretion system F family protein [Geomonas terrae]TGU70163.1 pilus assembly protein [Geomonas terrae]